MHNSRITILINQRPFHFEQEILAPGDFREAVDLPAEYEVWRIVHNPDPERSAAGRRCADHRIGNDREW